ncbi:MAG: outer membrane protein transport protein [Acidobacteria bacterium]|nr:outer membrane protein transport protein [Acidobacteriota bacterium]
MKPRRDARHVRSVILALSAVILTARPVSALTDEDIFRGYQLHFVTAGARAAGMGGAFVAVADDASAAELNPAGLSLIPRSLAYAEYGSLEVPSNPARSRVGNLEVNPVTGGRNLPYLALASDRGASTTQSPALLAFSWPFTYGGGHRIAFGVSRQVTYSEETTLSGAGGTAARFSFDTFPNTVSGGQVVAYSIAAPVAGRLSGETVAWNGVVSAQIHADFSVGLTLSQSVMNMSADTRVRVVDPLAILADGSHPRLPSQSTADVYTTHLDGSDSNLTYAIGVLWRPGSSFTRTASPWQFGATYRKGTRFGVGERTSLNGALDRTIETRFPQPDTYSAGAAYRAAGRFAVTAQMDRVEYSDLLRGFDSGVNYVTGPHLAMGAFSTRRVRRRRFSLDDGTVLRVGGEYVVPVRIPSGGALSVRGGFFRTPDTQQRMIEFNSTDHSVNATYRHAYAGGNAENHFTLGAGAIWDRMGVQVAWEKSDIANRILASFSYGVGAK